MAGEYNINLSNGNVLSALYPLEVNGPDNRSTPRLIQDVRPQYQVSAVDAATETFTIVGDFTQIFRPNQTFEVVGSTGNDGTYTVSNSSFGGGNTTIVVNENIIDVNPDGSIIVHVFVLNGDLTYRFVSGFTFDVQESGGLLLTGVDNAAETFSVAGDQTNIFTTGKIFSIINSTSNDGLYTTVSSAFVSGITTITVAENVIDNTIDGEIDGLINGTYTVTPEGSAIFGNTTIIPVIHGSIRDNVINSIGLPYGQIQYTIADNNSSLKLPGKGTMQYGEMIVENLVRMTEHFANDVAPELNTNIGTNPVGTPLTGQLWYKTLLNEEGYLFYDGTSWSNQWDFDNGTMILRDPQNTTTPNSDIYLTADETQLPANYVGTNESGMVIWNEVDPVAQDAIFRVLSYDGTENLRVEHNGYVRTYNNLEVIGGGNGTVESYFHGKLGIGDNGLPTIERTLTVEGNGISVNADTGLNAGIILDCPSVTEQSIIEFEVANNAISRIHTETNASTVWESQSQTTANVSELIIRGGNTDSGNNGGNILINAGQNAGGNQYQNAGNVQVTGGGSVDGFGGTVSIFGGTVSGSVDGNFTGGGIDIIGGAVNTTPAGSVGLSAGGTISIVGGEVISGNATAGNIDIRGGNSNDNTISSPGNVFIGGGIPGDSTGSINSGYVKIYTPLTDISSGYATTGKILLETGSGSSTGHTTGNVELFTGNGYSVGNIILTNGITDPASSSDGASILLTSGVSGGSGATKGGDIVLQTTGTGAGGAADGTIQIVGNTNAVGSVDILGNVGINVSSPATLGPYDLSVFGGIQTGTSFYGSDGTVVAPTYSFTTDQNTGLFLSGLNQLGFVVNGTNVFDIYSNGTLHTNVVAYENQISNGNDIPNKQYVDDGLAAQDELAELNDTNIVAPAEDQVLTYSGGVWVNKTALPQYEEYSAIGGETVVNTSIPTVANTGSPGLATLQVFVNGIFQMEGASKNYTVTGTNQITFNAALIASDDVAIYSFNR